MAIMRVRCEKGETWGSGNRSVVAPSRLAGRLAGAFARSVYRGSDIVLAASKAFFSSIAEVGGARDLRFFPQWGDRPELGKSSEDLTIPQLPSGFIVMFTGNLGGSQDLETVLDAA